MSCVYFIHNSETGRTKIGYTDGDPVDRLNKLQVANDCELVLVWAVYGGRRQEQALHRLLAEHRVRGEWFSATGEQIAQAIEKLGLEAMPPIRWQPSLRPLRRAVDGFMDDAMANALASVRRAAR